MKYKVSLFFIMFLSLVLISVSYSKYSNKVIESNVYKESFNNIDIIYDNDNVLVSNKDNVISIINKNNHNIKYALKLIPLDIYNESIYYSIDNGNIKLLDDNNILLVEELDKLGSYNDHISHSIRINSSYNSRYIISIIEV